MLLSKFEANIKGISHPEWYRIMSGTIGYRQHAFIDPIYDVIVGQWLRTVWYIKRFRIPVGQAFSHGIRHVFIVIKWTVTHSSVNRNKNMSYPVWKCLPYGSPQHPYYWITVLLICSSEYHRNQVSHRDSARIRPCTIFHTRNFPIIPPLYLMAHIWQNWKKKSVVLMLLPWDL